MGKKILEGSFVLKDSAGPFEYQKANSTHTAAFV
jgi:hypothetical protein